jgi:hypothetical protein
MRQEDEEVEKKNQKKTFAIFLVLVLMFTVLPGMRFTAAAASMGETGELGAAEKLNIMIRALPDPSEINLESEEELQAMSEQISAIFSFAEENGLELTEEQQNVINAIIMVSYSPSLTADPVAYKIWVNGIQVTSDNAADVLGDSDSGATVTYDEASNTLILNGASLNIAADGSVNRAIEATDGVNIQLTGTNTISTLKSVVPVYSGSGGITIQGSGSLDIQCQVGSIFAEGLVVIDGATVTSTTLKDYFLGMESHTGIEIKNGADVTVKTNGASGFSCLNSNSDDGYISISNSRISMETGESWSMGAAGDITITNSIVSAVSAGVAIGSDYGDVVISGGTIDVKSTGSDGNGIYTASGKIIIKDGAKLTAVSNGYPALYGENGIFITESRVDASSLNDAAIFSPSDIEIVKSIVEATGADGLNGILARGIASVSGSWIRTSGDDTFVISDSVLIKGNSGEVTGDAVIPGDVIIPEHTELTVPTGASLTVLANVTLTNDGTINVYGGFNIDGTLIRNGTIVCNTHTGGTATCTQKAICSICGKEYGELSDHSLVKTDGKASTCTEAGYETYWTCSVCNKLFSDENGTAEITAPIVIPVIDHSFGTEWNYNTVNHWKECSCGEKSDISAHTFGNWIIVNTSVSGESGIRERSCKICGYKETAEISYISFGPGYDGGTVLTPAAFAEENGNKNAVSPQTGDKAQTVLWISLLAAGGIGLAVIILVHKKRKTNWL